MFGIPFNLATYRDAHNYFAQAFFKKHSLTLDSVIGLLAAMAYLVWHYWRDEPHKFFIRHWQRAYDGPQDLGLYIEALESNLPDALRFGGLSIEPSAVDPALH